MSVFAVERTFGSTATMSANDLERTSPTIANEYQTRCDHLGISTRTVAVPRVIFYWQPERAFVSVSQHQGYKRAGDGDNFSGRTANEVLEALRSDRAGRYIHGTCC